MKECSKEVESRAKKTEKNSELWSGDGNVGTKLIHTLGERLSFKRLTTGKQED